MSKFGPSTPVSSSKFGPSTLVEDYVYEEKEPSIGELIEYGFDKGEADYEKWAAGSLASIDVPELRNIMGAEIGISS